MMFKNDSQRRAVFASLKARRKVSPTESLATVTLSPESVPGIQVGGAEEEHGIDRYASALAAIERAQLEQRKRRLATQKRTEAIQGFQQGYQSAAPVPAPMPAPPPEEEFEIPEGGLEEKYPYLVPFERVVPEVADVAKGGGQAVKGAIAGGALATGLGIASGMSRPWRFGALGAVGGALPGALTSVREVTDIPAVAFDAGKEAVRIGLAQASPMLQTAGQLVQLGTIKAGDVILSPYTYGPSIHDRPETLDYPPYYAKRPKNDGKATGSGAFSDDEIDAIKSELSEEFGYHKASETEVNQYAPSQYMHVAMSENKDQPIEASQSSAFYDPRADKLHVAILPNKMQSLRSIVHDLAHGMGHFKDDPGLNEGMAEYMSMKIMKKMGIPTDAAKEQIGYKKEYEQVKGLVDKHGENAVKQVFMTTHDSSDLARNMMFDSRIHKSRVQDIAPQGMPILDFDKEAKKNGKPKIVERFKDATFNIDKNNNS